MATLSTAAKNAALDALATLLDAGSVFDRASVQILTAGFATQLFFNFLSTSSPTFNSASGGSMSVRTLPNDWTGSAADASNTGVAGSYVIFDGNAVPQIFDTSGVGLSGSGKDIEMDNTNVRAGQGMIVDTFELFIP